MFTPQETFEFGKSWGVAFAAAFQGEEEMKEQQVPRGFGKILRDMANGGYNVDIRHVRQWFNPIVVDGEVVRWVWDATIPQAYNEGLSPKELLSTGGRTVVTIHDIDGDCVVGEAICSPKDAYNRREGVRIAFERAKEKLRRLEMGKRLTQSWQDEMSSPLIRH